MQFWTAAGLSAEQRMPKATYVYVHRRISMALAPELSEAEAAEAAEEDWVDDSGWLGQVQNEIAFDNYAGGLFGVADMWTESVDELEYVIFANKLYRRITKLSTQLWPLHPSASDTASEPPNATSSSWQLARSALQRPSWRTFRELREIASLAPATSELAGSVGSPSNKRAPASQRTSDGGGASSAAASRCSSNP